MTPAPGYPPELMDHFRHPRNVGELERPDAEARVTGRPCGDVLHLTFALDGRRIAAVRFRCLGCAVAIASGSAATVALEGRTVDEALALTEEDVAALVGGIDERRRSCAVLVRDAMRQALAPFAGGPA